MAAPASFARQLAVHSADRDPAGRASLLQSFTSAALAAKNKVPYLTMLHQARRDGVLSEEEWRSVFDDLAASYARALAEGSVYGASHF